MARPNSLWINRNHSTIVANAALGGLCAIISMLLRRRQVQVKELAPFLDPLWTDALYHGSPLRPALTAVVGTLYEAIWGREHTANDGGQYVLYHPRAEKKEYYPGSFKFFSEGVTAPGQTRWPWRYAEHILAATHDASRDGNTPRGVLFRRLGVDSMFGLPTYLGTKVTSFNREQRIIRTRRPKTVGRHSEEMIRPGRQRNVRHRPCQSERRRQRAKEERDHRLPRRNDNFNVTPQFERQWTTDDSMVFKPPLRNYTTAYHEAARTLSSTGTGAYAPIDIRDPTTPWGMRLLGEFAATPGKKIEHLLTQYSREDLCNLATTSINVGGPYRKAVMIKRLMHELPRRGVPPPVTYNVKLPNLMAWCRHWISEAMRLIVSKIHAERPQLAAMTKKFTAIVIGRDERYSDSLVTERRACMAFDLKEVEGLPEARIAEMRKGKMIQVSRVNWDVPIPPNELVVKKAIWRMIGRWMTHFGIDLETNDIKDVVKRTLKRCEEDRQPMKSLSDQIGPYLPRNIPPTEAIVMQQNKMQPPFLQWEDDEQEYTGVRIDKNEHAVSREPIQAYWVRLADHTIWDTRTFRRTRLSMQQAAWRLGLNYAVRYPERFRDDRASFEPYMLPTVASRVKEKCLGPEGIGCQREGHIHFRIVVDTSRLPSKQMSGLGDIETIGPAPELRDVQAPRRVNTEYEKSREQLVFPEEYKDQCARCDGEKDDCTLTKTDIGALFTHTPMDEAAAEGPEVLRRSAAATGVDTVTVERTPGERGHVGGIRWASWKRRVFTHQELLQYAEYERRLNLVALGNGGNAIVLEQIQGAPMGGRFSVFKSSSLVLSGREGRFIEDVQLQQQHRFHIPGYTLLQLVNLIRYVDDGNPASGVYCRRCVGQRMKLIRGSDLNVSEEEYAGDNAENCIQFLDGQERYYEGRFYYRYQDRHMIVIDGKRTSAAVRFMPKPWNGHPIRYLRALLLGRLARIYQIEGDGDTPALRGAWELMIELTRKDRGYQWCDFVSALSGAKRTRERRLFRTLRTWCLFVTYSESAAGRVALPAPAA